MTKAKSPKYTLDDEHNYAGSKKYDKLLKHAAKEDENIISFSVRTPESKHNKLKAMLALQGIQLKQAFSLIIDAIIQEEIKITKKQDNSFTFIMK